MKIVKLVNRATQPTHTQRQETLMPHFKPCSPAAPRWSAAWLNSLPPNTRRALIEGLDEDELETLSGPDAWWFWARDEQLPPAGNWRTWVFMGGRGAGKTRAGAEWLRSRIAAGANRVAIAGATLNDAREVMIDGPSGLRAIARNNGERPIYEASRRRLVWPNGAVGLVFSAEEPDRVRGAEVSAVWADEFCAWKAPQEMKAMVDMALRVGERPQMLITTTPRPIPALRNVLDAGDTVLTRASTWANAANLSPAFLSGIEAAYAHTGLGRQELDGEIVDDVPGALWSRDGLHAARIDSPPLLDAIVVGLDPPASVGPNADACGMIVAGAAGQGQNRCVYVLADRTVQGLSPNGWAAATADAVATHDADYVVAEVNQGGAMVEEVLRVAAPNLRVRPVRAHHGKRVRAEPVAALYAQGRVKHVGRLAPLEDEMCAFDGALSAGHSPDRLDALVWAVWALALEKTQANPRIRGV